MAGLAVLIGLSKGKGERKAQQKEADTKNFYDFHSIYNKYIKQ